jgi:hypothetical protein
MSASIWDGNRRPFASPDDERHVDVMQENGLHMVIDLFPKDLVYIAENAENAERYETSHTPIRG